MWSWQSDPPMYNGERLCAGLSLTQGWKTASCSEEYYSVCREPTTDLLMLSSKASSAAGASSCPISSRPSSPVTSSENSHLLEIMKKDNISFVWLNVWSDSERCWEHAGGAGPVCDRPRVMAHIENGPIINQATMAPTNIFAILTIFLLFLIAAN